MAEVFRLTAYCCGTCKHWKRGAVFGGKRQSASGFCRNRANETPRQMEGYEIGLATLDLAVCTNWETAEPSLWDPEAEKAAGRSQTGESSGGMSDT